MYRLFLLLFLQAVAVSCAAQSGESDMAKAFRKGLENAEAKHVRELQPKAYINGSQYTDSAYGFRFRFEPGDSIVNHSANGQIVVLIEGHLFFARLSSVAPGMSLADYAKKQRGDSKDKAPDGATHYKVSRLSDENYTYRYNIRYTSKDGLATVSSIRIRYSNYSYGLLKVAAIFPDDAQAPAREERIDRLMRSVETFSLGN